MQLSEDDDEETSYLTKDNLYQNNSNKQFNSNQTRKMTTQSIQIPTQRTSEKLNDP